MKMLSIEQELKSNSYPGRGIILGKAKMEQKRLPLILSWEEAKTAAIVFL
mgnify:CR=1 FL=1